MTTPKKNLYFNSSRLSFKLEEITPLCVRIEHAFTSEEVNLIHELFKFGTAKKIRLLPNNHNQIRVDFNQNYIPCQLLNINNNLNGKHSLTNGKTNSKTVTNHNKNKNTKPKNATKQNKASKINQTNEVLYDERDLITVKISDSQYANQQHIANVICKIQSSRIHNHDYQTIMRCRSEHRSFGVTDGYYSKNKRKKDYAINTNDSAIRGHYVTYLDPIFQLYAKSIYDKMIHYCKCVDYKLRWNLLQLDSYRPKCFEYIQYAKDANLGWHCDMGSLITVVIMCTESEQYTGGAYQCKNILRRTKDEYNEYAREQKQKGEDAQKPYVNDYVYQDLNTVSVNLDRGDCVIFHSDKCNHRVTDVLDGKRITFVTEIQFW